MRNQFVGDINDYHKYKALNELSRSSDINVCWMLNDDIQGQDSKFVNYKIYDELAIFLKNLVKTGQRNVQEIENSNLVKVKHYYRQIKDIKIDEINGILFFDPDNGIEVKSSKRNDNRYIYYDDIRRFITKVDVLVYQQFPRVVRQQYIEKLTSDISREVKCSTITHFPESLVDFILIKKKLLDVKG
jgi:hypothetical protein